MAFSTVTAAVSLRAPLAAQRVRASSSPRGTMTMIPAVASQRAVSSETRLTQRGSGGVAGDATLALKMPALRNKAVRNTAVTRAMAKDEESTAGISKKVARTSQACKTLGRWGFWGQLVLSTVSAVILVFSFLFKGITKATDAGLYFILFGIVTAYFTTFWSLGIGKLGDKLRKAVDQLDLVPPRTEVVRQLSTGLAVNFVGLGATIVGMQATTGLLFAKSLSAAAAAPFTPGYTGPVLALDIFLIQAGANVMLAHWIGASVSLWLLRTVNLPTPQR
mmetsp:Transcript_6696/g.30241  ORF Transcript_6696/g.30241 Transcript_6696/m.30241 type:complete len:277 (-) Transcript_6696:59-889(-)